MQLSYNNTLQNEKIGSFCVQYSEAPYDLGFSCFFNIILKCYQAVSDLLFIVCGMFLKVDKLGNDIDQLRLENCNWCDQLMQDHLDKFYKRMESWWHPENAERTVDLFKKNIAEANSNSCGFSALKYLTSEYRVPNISSEERHVIKMLSKIERKDNGYEKLCERLSLRDIKVYHNTFVKCMNYAVKTNKRFFINELCNAQMVFNEYDKQRILQPEHAEHLNNDKDFNELLKALKPYVKANVNRDLSNENIPIIIDLLIDCFVDGGPLAQASWHGRSIDYENMVTLMLFANNVSRNLEVYGDMNSVERDIYILRVARAMGLVNDYLLMKVNRVVDDRGKRLSEELKHIMLEDNVDIDGIRSCVESFPKVIHHATKPIEIQFKMLFSGNIYH